MVNTDRARKDNHAMWHPFRSRIEEAKALREATATLERVRRERLELLMDTDWQVEA